MAATAPVRTSNVKGFERRRPSRKPFPEHLARERVVVPAPASCTCCGSQQLSKVGEDVTETLEVIPRQWKVIQTVREKFTCRDGEKLSQPPGAVSRGAARLGGSEPARHHRVREVRTASAAEPPERTLRPRGRRAQRLDAGRPTRWARAPSRCDRCMSALRACAGGATSAR